MSKFQQLKILDKSIETSRSENHQPSQYKENILGTTHTMLPQHMKIFASSPCSGFLLPNSNTTQWS